ncbi:MAG: hypothetical protein JEZ04_10340 [Spirochaetales bacterium]|nr:hypothetical protein [Spirochaetales bacterium]
MVKRKVILGGILIMLVALTGCLTPTASVEVKQDQDRPTFNDSHAILIEKTIREIPIKNLITGNIKSGEKVIVAAMEKVYNDETGLVPLIEDNLIYNVTELGYAVLEREDEILFQLDRERGNVYTAFAERNLPVDPILRLIYEMDKNGLNYLDFSEVLTVANNGLVVNGNETLTSLDTIDPAVYAEILSFYKSLDASFFEKRNNAVADVQLLTADVLVSYRVLECGILIDIEQKEVEQSEKSSTLSDETKKLWRHKYSREANTRLFVRVIDAKTGEIRGAKIVENINNDEIEFWQGDEESDGDYFRRMTAYEKLLRNYHYSYYDQQLPLQRGTSAQQVFVKNEKVNEGDGQADAGFFGGGEESDSLSLSVSGGDAEMSNEDLWATIGIAGGIGLGAILIGVLLAGL